MFFFCLEVSFSAFFSLTYKEEAVWPDGTHPMLFEELSCICMPSFRYEDLFFFLVKVPFLAFLNTEWDVEDESGSCVHILQVLWLHIQVMLNTCRSLICVLCRRSCCSNSSFFT